MTIEVPTSWNALTWEQLRHMWQLIDQYKDEPQQLTLHAWLYLAGLEFVKDETALNAQGDTLYLLRHKGKEHEDERLAVTSSDLHLHLNGIHFTDEQREALTRRLREEAMVDTRSDIEKELGLPFKPKPVDDHTFDDRPGTMEWVLNPFTLTALPKEYIKVHGRHFLLPSPQFMSLSWQQYTNCQKLLNASMSVHDETSDVNLFRFFAHLLVSGRRQFFSIDNDSFRINVGKSYIYRVKDAERNVKHMQHIDHIDGRILVQWFQSCQELMRQKGYFPELFTGKKEHSISAPIINEINTINAIMKWEGTYPSQQSVYDTNALSILGNLKDMTLEAEEVRKMQKSVKK